MYGPPLHALFVLLGTGAAVVVFLAGAGERRRLDLDLLTVLGGSLFGGSVGAKLAVVWRYVDTVADPS
ncbi:MAG TPA: hypothetical protein VH394_24110, partial [Thermoanaerobaculia bacterium]|nr:hypothetical protein [Thermoanaerobaculia bacterium]